MAGLWLPVSSTLTGLPSVITWRTHSGAWCAPYSENTPPRLQPTRLTLRPLWWCRWRIFCSSAAACRRWKPTLRPKPQLCTSCPGRAGPAQRRQRGFVGHEAGQQQHRVAVAARRLHQQRPAVGSSAISSKARHSSSECRVCGGPWCGWRCVIASIVRAATPIAQ